MPPPHAQSWCFIAACWKLLLKTAVVLLWSHWNLPFPRLPLKLHLGSHSCLTGRANGVKMMAQLCCSPLSAQHFQFVLYCHPLLSSQLHLLYGVFFLLQYKYPEWDNVWCLESRLFFHFCWTPEKEFLQSSRGHRRLKRISWQQMNKWRLNNLHESCSSDLNLFSCFVVVWNQNGVNQ